MSLAAESRYLDLVRRLALRPIRDDAVLGAAIVMIDELLALPDLSEDERDYLEVLSDLVEKYEEAEHPIPPAPLADVLRYLMECRGIGPTELAEEAGIPASVVSGALAGERGLGKAYGARLATYFHVGVDTFL